MAKRLRIISGLILIVFVAMHLTNIAMGLSSVALMEQMQPWLLGPWQNPFGGPLLLTAMLVHMALGFHAMYKRNTFNMSRNDVVQIVSSLILVPLMIPHLVGTILASDFFDLPQDFPGILLFFWFYQPGEGLRQVILLAAIWIHGCIGLFIWLRLQPWWQRVSLFCYPIAVALPVLAMLGYVEGGKQVMSGEVEVVYAQPPEGGPTIDEIITSLGIIKYWLIGIFLAITAVVLIARWWRVMGNDGATRVRYAGQPAYTSENGLTLLESATVNDIPHAALCGGRGRCGTCRVKVISSSVPLPEPAAEELKTLKRIGADDDVRLACQMNICGGQIDVARILPPHIKPSDLHAVEEAASGSPLDDGLPEAAQ